MRTRCQFVFSGLLAVLMLASPIAYQRWRNTDCRNFRVVQEGVLYRSGQVSTQRLNQFVIDHGIRTVVSLRDVKEPPDPLDRQEERWLKSKGMKFVRMPPLTWYPDATGEVPAEVNLRAFRAVMDDPANYPVLVHCFAGIHRTGIMCAVFRMDYQGWTNKEATAEMRTLGYTILDNHADVRWFLNQYRSPPHTAKNKRLETVPTSRHND